jgi:hypothetical protein
MSNDKIDLILSKLNDIERRLDKIESSCNGMDHHIGFIENVYGTLRSPLDYVTRQVNRLSGAPQESLPSTTQRKLK